MKPDFSLVIACYNEETYLEAHVVKVREILDLSRFTYELIFVDDCSRDATRSIIERLCAERSDARYLFHEHNTGRGGSITDGIKLALADVAGMIDIDLETSPVYLPMLIQLVRDGADVASAHRIYEFRWRSIPRWIMSRGYRWLLRQVIPHPLQDTETGCKIFNRERILPILSACRDTRWFWDTEVMILPYLKGFRMVELPTLFVRRAELPSSVQPWRDSWRHFVSLLEFRKRLRGNPQIFTD